MKTIAKIICMFIALMSFGSAQAANIELLEVVDTKTLHVSISEVKMWTGEVVGEVKVLNDMSIAFANQDEEDTYKAILTLDEPLEKNTEYSLLTVFGADGSIDFKTNDTIEGVEILNSEVEEVGQWIESITLVDVNSIEVTYIEELTGDDFEFKLLSDVVVESISSIDDETVEVKLESEVGADKNYILMVLSLQDALAQDVELDEGIYDFMTPKELRSASKGWISEPEESLDISELEEELDVELSAATDELETPEESDELLTRDLDAVVEEETSTVNNIEDVALSATATPETGAETGILILLTLFINTFYYFSRRKAS